MACNSKTSKRCKIFAIFSRSQGPHEITKVGLYKHAQKVAHEKAKVCALKFVNFKLNQSKPASIYAVACFSAKCTTGDSGFVIGDENFTVISHMHPKHPCPALKILVENSRQTLTRRRLSNQLFGPHTRIMPKGYSVAEETVTGVQVHQSCFFKPGQLHGLARH